MKEKEKQKDAAFNAGLGAAASETVGRYGSAVSEHIKGYTGEIGSDGKFVKGLKDIAKSRTNSYTNLKQQAGYSGEVLHENRTNAAQIIKKNSNRIRRTDAIGEINHEQFDHVRTDASGKPITDQHGNYTATSQMKLRGHYDLDEYIKQKQMKNPNWKPPKDLTEESLIKLSAKDNVKELLYKKDFSKYEKADFLDIPSEQYEHAKKYLHDRQMNIKKQISALEQKGDTKALQAKEAELQRVKAVDKRLRSSVSSEDAMTARTNPMRQTAKEIHGVAKRAGIEQAKYGAIIGGTVSLSRNIMFYASGEEKDLKKLSANVAKDTAGAASLSFATGYSGAVIKGVMERSGKQIFQNLSKSNMPALIATSTLEVGKSIHKYLTDEDFDELQLIEELGEKGTGMMAASIGAAIGTAVLPVFGTAVGAVVGGMAGYMTGSAIYCSTMELLKDERISDANREKVEALANESIKQMQKEREELSHLIETQLAERQIVFENCFTAIDDATRSNDHDEFTAALTHLAITFGVEMQFTNFDDFDNFMADESTVFKF